MYQVMFILIKLRIIRNQDIFESILQLFRVPVKKILTERINELHFNYY